MIRWNESNVSDFVDIICRPRTIFVGRSDATTRQTLLFSENSYVWLAFYAFNKAFFIHEEIEPEPLPQRAGHSPVTPQRRSTGWCF